MKRLLYWLGLVTLVWTKDMDGEVRLRIVWYSRETGDPFVYRLLGPTMQGTPYLLDPSGEVVGGGYVRRWYAYADRPNRPSAGLTWRKR